MEEGSLFGPEKDHKVPIYEIPLAERMRPDTADDYAGQEHILGPGKPLRIMLEGGKVPSCILYGHSRRREKRRLSNNVKNHRRELLEINAVSARPCALL